MAYTVRRGGEVQAVDLGPVDQIDRLALALHDRLSAPLPGVRAAGRALGERVFDPLGPLIGKAEHLLIAADGALDLVPFAALLDADNHYLVKRYRFTHLNNARDLLDVKHPEPPREGPYIFAGPDFDSSVAAGGEAGKAVTVAATASPRSRDFKGFRFTPLPGTVEEAEDLAALLTGAQVRLGKQASEATLKAVRGPRLLHIATHGFFLADQPSPSAAAHGVALADVPATVAAARSAQIENPLLRSGLVLAGANSAGLEVQDEDGVLTALEAAGLDLSGTQLVVLSACETGLGEVRNGEGVFGLRRAFAIAGAQSEVTSLWKVSDQATRDLMVAYYERLLAGEGRSEALRQVQLAMLASGAHAHPYYWAAFIQLGDWNPLEPVKGGSSRR